MTIIADSVRPTGYDETEASSVSTSQEAQTMLYARIKLTEPIKRHFRLKYQRNYWHSGTEFYIRQEQPGYGMVVCEGPDAGLGVPPGAAEVLETFDSLLEMAEAARAELGKEQTMTDRDAVLQAFNNIKAELEEWQSMEGDLGRGFRLGMTLAQDQLDALLKDGDAELLKLRYQSWTEGTAAPFMFRYGAEKTDDFIDRMGGLERIRDLQRRAESRLATRRFAPDDDVFEFIERDTTVQEARLLTSWLDAKDLAHESGQVRISQFVAMEI